MIEMVAIDKKEILHRLNNALAYQFEGYSWADMIDDTNLTLEEKEWAKENVSYMAYQFTKES